MKHEFGTKYSYKIKSEDGLREIMIFSGFGSGWRIPNYSVYTSHVEMDIIHFKEMQGVFSIGDKDYEVEPGDVFIVRSNERHKITTVSQAGLVENIQVDPVFLWHDRDYYGLKFLAAFNADIPNFKNRIDRNSRIYKNIIETIDSMCDEFSEEKYGFEQMVKMKMYVMLFSIARDRGYCDDGDENAGMPRLDAIRKSMRYIDEHLCEDITVPRLAEIAGLSPNYYRTLFKQIAGISPVKYITAKRVNRASALLKYYEGNMIDLALECGFNSTASFNRAFRMYTGQVPSKYLPYVL